MRENSEERSVAGDRTRLGCRRGHRHHDSSRAAARCSVSLQTYSPIKEGSTGAQAKAMECLLAKAGFATTVNGRFSAGDAEELAKFRKSIGLKPLLVGGRRAWSTLLARGTTPGLAGVTTARMLFGFSWRCGRPVSSRCRPQAGMTLRLSP